MYSEIFRKFEANIVFGCHSARAETSRSEAGKKIMDLGAKVLPELYNYLKDSRLKAKYESLDEKVKHSWGMLLSWMCEQHCLERNGIPQSDFEAWMKWLENKPAAC